MKGQKIKKKAAVATTAALLVVTCIGSLAFFTDRENADATATAGNIDLVFTDESLAIESTGDDVQARDNVWTDKKLVVDNGILNPGDTIDMDYKVANAGSKSIDVRQQITLTSDVALTDNAEEYTITVAGQSITPVKSDDDKTLTYSLADITLNGSIETETGVTVTEQGYDVAMAFAKAAKNAFMDSNVTVKLDIQAKQHRNTTASDFAAWASYTTDYEQK